MTLFWFIWSYLYIIIIFETRVYCASTSGCLNHSHSVWLLVWLTCIILLFLFYLSQVFLFPVYFFMFIFTISVLWDCILFWFLISYKSSFCCSTGCFCVHSIHLYIIVGYRQVLSYYFTYKNLRVRHLHSFPVGLCVIVIHFISKCFGLCVIVIHFISKCFKPSNTLFFKWTVKSHFKLFK